MVEAPLHAQIRQTIQEKITTGQWPPQSRIPPEEKLAQQFRVSRMTIRKAMQRLVENGFLYRRQGVGTFVSPIYMQRDLSRMTSFSEDAAARSVGAHSEVQSVEVECAAGAVAHQLLLDPQRDNVIRIERLRLYDDTPVALQTLWVPQRLCPELEDPKVAAGSVYAYYEQGRNFRLGWGVQSIEARMPTLEEKTQLQMPHTAALFLVRRTTFLDDGIPLELSETRYRSDKQVFMATLQR